ncbi:hypothetical protein [Ancylomarina longa]|uniref:Protein BatD n=1 Tax=Ancylomarina longa TaxID=2487017 RepID=A0A434AZV5_9BACT|nr:hypothetical protein [Ancylomarina longa]RUT80149.1 hypothetical protein DLK05_02005 [Ancylomarina longa]
MKNFLAKTIITAVFIFGIIILPTELSAQNPNPEIKYSVRLDTNIIVIGDQINLNLSVEQPKDLKIAFPAFADSIMSGVEIITQSPQDTTKLDNGNVKVHKNFVITSFDGGIYKMKPFEFQIHEENFSKSILTDTLVLGVKTMAIDTTKANFDIVMPIQTPISFAEVVPWLLGGIVFIALIILLIWYLRFRKKNQPLFATSKPIEPAHVIALRKLDEIKQDKLWQTGKIKLYYSELTDTLRIYLDERFDLSTQESTTDEIMQAVDNVEVNNEWHTNLKEILERADLAKFAKFQPLPDENERSLKFAYKIVEDTIIAEKKKEESEVSETLPEKSEANQ